MCLQQSARLVVKCVKMIFKNLPTWFWKDWKSPDFYFVVSKWRDGITQSGTFFFSLSKGNPSLFLFFTMKFSICTANKIVENFKKEFRKDISFPKLNKMALLLGRMKEVGKFLPDPSTTTYYYTHSFVSVFYWRPTPWSHQSKSWSPNSWPNFSMSPECCYFSSHWKFSNI